jgi:hypothetical protein
LAILAFMCAVVSSSSVYADGGAIGSGGEASGGSGGAQTKYGWGWYSYKTSGGITPAGFTTGGGGPWSKVSDTCSGVGADRVIAFIVLKTEGVDASTGVVYNYKTSWNGFQHYNGNAGGDWLPTSTAKSLYDGVDINKTGYTWGDNVAWFCYSSTPKVSWSIVPFVSASINDPNGPSTDIAKPGDTIYWRHRVKNSNSSTDTTDKDISIYWKNVSGFSNNGATGNLGAVSASNGLSKGEVIPKLTDNPYYSGLDNGYKLQDSDDGRVLCRTTIASPGYSGSNDLVQASSDACVTVKKDPIYKVSTCRPDIKVSVGKHITDLHNNNVIPVSVRLISGSKVIDKGNYTEPTEITITNDCYTGDVWRVQESSDSYVYKHGDYPYSCGTEESPKTCYEHRDYSTSYSKTQTVGPCYNYSLQTKLQLGFYQVESETSISLDPKIDSQKAVAAYNQTHTHEVNWSITKLVVPPNIPAPSVPPGYHAYNPCAYIIDKSGALAANETCSTYLSGSSVVTGNNGGSNDFNESASPSVSGTYHVEDLSSGNKVCFMFSILGQSSEDNGSFNKYTYNGDRWAHSGIDPTGSINHSCVIVVKKPKVQIWGGDLWAGGSVISAPSVKSFGTFGSWIEYGILTSKTVAGTASGSAFAGASGGPSNMGTCGYSTLSFTNSACSSSIGGYVNTHTIPNIEASLFDITLGTFSGDF